jgi:hypothetical protein
MFATPLRIEHSRSHSINPRRGGGIDVNAISSSIARDFLSFSTRDIDAHRKVDYWDEQASSVITDLHVEPSHERAFEASLKAAEFGGIGFIDAFSTPTRVTHTRPAAQGLKSPSYLVHMQLSGTCVNRQMNREVILRGGDFVLCDSTLPCELLLGGDNRMLVLRIPQPTLKRRLVNPDLHINRHISGNRGVALLMSCFTERFWDECQRSIAPAASDRLAETLCDLLAAALAEAGPMPFDRSAKQTLLKLRIRQFVDANLADPGLTPRTVARNFNITALFVHMLQLGGDESLAE